MKYLFIDTETTGLPVSRDLSPMESDQWPRLVSVAYILTEEREVIDEGYYIIKPKGFIIPLEATKVHGITTAKAISEGHDLSDVLDTIKAKIDECALIVGHNVDFDINVLDAEFYRYNGTLPVHLKHSLCTMLVSKDFCNLPNNKYPKLGELYEILKGEPMTNAHNAMADTQAAMECYWLLDDSGIVNKYNKRDPIFLYPTKDNIEWAIPRLSRSSYITKINAFFTIACVLKYDRYNRSGDVILSRHQKYLLFKNPKSKLVEKNGQVEFVDCTEEEWIEDCYQFFLKILNDKDSYNKIYEAVKAFENEVGGKEAIKNNKIKEPQHLATELVLMKGVDWFDITIRSLKQNKSFKPQLFKSYFKSIVKSYNKVREDLNNKEREKYIETKLYYAQYGVDIDKGEIPNDQQVQRMINDRQRATQQSNKSSSSSSGCMVMLPLVLGVGSAFCYFLLNIIG